MTTSSDIKQEISKIDATLEELCKRKSELNKTLKDIENQKVQQEMERWQLSVGSTFFLFCKYNDADCSTVYGYEILDVSPNNFLPVLETIYCIDSGDVSMKVNRTFFAKTALRSFREENNVYIVDTESYRRLQTKMLSLGIDYSSLNKCEDELKSVTLYQVE